MKFDTILSALALSAVSITSAGFLIIFWYVAIALLVANAPLTTVVQLSLTACLGTVVVASVGVQGYRVATGSCS